MTVIKYLTSGISIENNINSTNFKITIKSKCYIRGRRLFAPFLCNQTFIWNQIFKMSNICLDLIKFFPIIIQRCNLP